MNDKFGSKRMYNSTFKERGNPSVVLADVIPVKDGQLVRVTFEGSSSPWAQGVFLKSDRELLINDQLCRSAEIWKETDPLEVRCTCRTDDGLLLVYNIWNSGRGYGTESQTQSSGMLVEDIPNGRRYRCNDIGFDTNFDKLVFRITW